MIPDAPQRYGPLLDALAVPDNLDPEDLSGPVYARWFKSPAIQQVIDARQSPEAIRAQVVEHIWGEYLAQGAVD